LEQINRSTLLLADLVEGAELIIRVFT